MKGQSPPDLAWHTAVALAELKCMLVYGGAIVKPNEHTANHASEPNYDMYAFYFESRHWAKVQMHSGNNLCATLHHQAI